MMSEEDEIRSELDRIDPNDLLGWISLATTLFNLAYSIAVPYYTFDWAISASFIFGVLSIMHNKRIVPKISLVVLALHLGVIAAIRTFS
jgi:fluoride ion exporter CrcB/FEX